MADPRVPSSMSPDRWSQVLSWLGVTVLALLILGVSFGPLLSAVDTQDLAGRWTIVSVDGEPASGSMELPGLFGHQGLSPDARVVVRRTVTLPDDGVPRAIWLENPQYALRLRWDGRVLASSGDPDAEGDDARSDIEVLAWLDPQAGPHELELDMRGAYGKGGLTGRTLIGAREDVMALAKQSDTDKLGLALMLALLGIVKFRVSARGPGREAYFWFGVFACVLSIWAFLHTDNLENLLHSVPFGIRMRRVMTGLLAPTGLAFTASFVYGRPRAAERVVLWLGVALAVPGVLLPTSWLYRLEQLQDACLMGFLAYTVVVLADGARRRVPGITLLLLTSFPPLVLGAVTDVLMTHGLTGGRSYMFPAFSVFVAGVAASLSSRFTDEARRHERLLAGSTDAMVSVDAGGRVTDVNPAAVSLLGNAAGSLLSDFAFIDDRTVVRDHIARGTQETDRVEFRFSVDPDAKVVESIATPLGDDTTLLVLRDVTKRRQMANGLLHAARMETIGVLVGGLAHNFNNMLGSLLGQVGVLQATVSQPAHLERLERMEASIMRASGLIRRLLTIAGGTSPDLEPVAVTQVCRNACELVEPTLPTGVRIALDVPGDLPLVLASASDLEQVLVNLLVNARDAVGPGGNLKIWLRPYTLPSGASGVAIVVDDDGPGVAAAIRHEVFEPFVTTKLPNKGTGLGLAVAAQVVRDHHGRIWVEDRPGGGARFCVALRRAEPEDGPGAGALQRPAVMLVEDEDALRDSYAAALRDAGFEVSTFANGLEADAALASLVPGILVTDVVMPGLSGIELATRFTARHPALPVLLVSGFIPDRTVPQLETGVWSRLDKPVHARRVVATVTRLCRHAERVAREGQDPASQRLFPSLSSLTSALLGVP